MRLLHAAAALPLLAGCTIDLTPAAVPRERVAIPAIDVAGSVLVERGEVDQRQQGFAVGGGSSARASYAVYTAAITQLLERELAQQGAAIQAGGKSLRVAVQYISWVNAAGPSACVIDFTVTMGDGRLRGLQARESGWSILGACDAALAKTVAETLRDPAVHRYLSEPPLPPDG